MFGTDVAFCNSNRQLCLQKTGRGNKMERKEYEIREPGNQDKLIKRVMGFDADDAIKNARLGGKYRVTCVINKPRRSNLIEVERI